MDSWFFIAVPHHEVERPPSQWAEVFSALLVKLTQVKGYIADELILAPLSLLKTVLCILKLLYSLQSKYILLYYK